MAAGNDRSPPVIIVGMHRSGTSMIARMLTRLGLFMGNDLEANQESLLFIECNKWLLRQCGGSWNHPVSIESFLANATVAGLGEEYIRYRLSHLPAHGYVGWRRYLKGERPLPALREPWGWKDPRTTFTLPFWTRLFPDARVVHIYRDGVAVAASLRARARIRLAEDVRRHRRSLKLGWYRWRAQRIRFECSIRCLDLMGGFSLWESYVEEGYANTERIAANVMTIKYEDFLDDPSTHLGRIAGFCGLSADEPRVVAVAADADKGRGDRSLADSELSEFRSRVRSNDWMLRLGYV